MLRIKRSRGTRLLNLVLAKTCTKKGKPNLKYHRHDQTISIGFGQWSRAQQKAGLPLDVSRYCSFRNLRLNIPHSSDDKGKMLNPRGVQSCQKNAEKWRYHLFALFSCGQIPSWQKSFGTAGWRLVSNFIWRAWHLRCSPVQQLCNYLQLSRKSFSWALEWWPYSHKAGVPVQRNRLQKPGPHSES